ncbi:MAG: hypothetical protein HFJ85_02120, partial [Oscillospiraceae bacterium]|nr:hypothetical protein [Oscillospiraceae bacterium]
TVRELTKELLEAPPVQKKTLFLKFTDRDDSRIVPALALLRKYPGPAPVKVYFEKTGKLAYAPGRLTALISGEVLSALEEILGKENISVKQA